MNLPSQNPNPDTIACIIPVYNEQDRLPSVLHTVVEADLFDTVLVVDDCSTDYTRWLARDFTEHRVWTLHLAERQGKARAVARALTRLPRSKFICLLDGDLIGLTPDNLHSLVLPVALGNATASISRRGKGSGLWPGLDIISGERVLPWWMLDAALSHCAHTGAWKWPGHLEMAINDILIQNRAPIAVVQWPGVTNPTKAEKYGHWRGLKEWARVAGNLAGAGMWTLARQTRRLNQQLVKTI